MNVGCLEEADECCKDSVKKFDPVEVAAKVEFALFETWVLIQ